MRRVNCSILDVRTVWRVGANFSLQLSSRTRFDKINKKKVIAENQCEKHKKSSLVACQKGLGKQGRPRSDCFFRRSLIGVFPACYSDKHFVNYSPETQHFI